jgi:hypothetical protein
MKPKLGDLTLPEAEFYMLADCRCELRFLAFRCKQYDPDPATTEAVVMAQRKYWRAIDPSWRLGKPIPQWSPTPSAEFVPSRAAFEKPMPKIVPHFDVTISMGYPTNGLGGDVGISIVSPKCKDCIEYFEPDVHTFYPLNFIFKNDSTLNCYAYFTTQTLDIAHVATSEAGEPDAYGEELRYLDKAPETSKFYDYQPPAFINVKRHAVAGKHWVRLHNLGGGPRPFFASEPLAHKLKRLLPRRCKFVPVKLVDIA